MPCLRRVIRGPLTVYEQTSSVFDASQMVGSDGRLMQGFTWTKDGTVVPACQDSPACALGGTGPFVVGVEGVPVPSGEAHQSFSFLVDTAPLPKGGSIIGFGASGFSALAEVFGDLGQRRCSSITTVRRCRRPCAPSRSGWRGR